MGNKNAFSKRLFAYSGLASAILSVAKNADAQVVYHDIFPDFLFINSDHFNLDLNNDGVVDLKFTYYWSQLTTNNWATSKYVSAFPGPDMVSSLPLNLNDTIDENLDWQSSAVFTRNGNTGPWLNILTDKFLPIKHIEGGHSYYGWVRLRCNWNHYTIYDWALDTIAEQPILAGDSGSIALPVQSFSVNNEKIKILQEQSTLQIIFSEVSNAPAQFIVVDALSRERYQSASPQTTKQIPIDDLETGEYLLSINTGSSKRVFRFFKD
jgi:hypothetical protein